MRKLNIGICDDEKFFHYLLESRIREFLSQREKDFNIQTFETGEELLAKATEFDIVFLDVVMPELDGYEVGRRLRKLNGKCKIIMVSSSERFEEAFKIKAFRFIRKPFRNGEIEEALEAAEAIEIGTEKIQLYDNRRLIEVEQRQIQCIIAYDSCAEFVINNQILRKDISLRELENVLDNQIFFRVNRKIIVNMVLIQDYRNGVIIINQEEILVSRRKKSEFEHAYRNFHFIY